MPDVKRAVPILPTLVVLAAVALMVRLGFWQLDRLHEKDALLAHYAAAAPDARELVWQRTAPAEADLYRRARLDCRTVLERSSMAGENAQGQGGMAITARCGLAGGGEALVVLGWARDPNAGGGWQGGTVHGTIGPGPRLIADPPVAGLAANAKPNASGIPNNHLSYAVQWFLFALTALIVYAVALRKRWRERAAD